MNHRRPKEISKIKRRQKIYDILNYGYNNQLNRLNKNHSLKCKKKHCKICDYLRIEKKLNKKRERIKNKKIEKSFL